MSGSRIFVGLQSKSFDSDEEKMTMPSLTLLPKH